MTDPTEVPVFVYAAKSSPDEKDSIESQIERIRERLDREPGRTLSADPFSEENVSGYKQSRGPRLEAALTAAKDAAAEHGHAELWVFHSSRLARGSGKKGQARALGQVFWDCRQHGVTLRSVEDDPYVTDEAFVGMASKMANKYSEDLSAHVSRGKRAAFERGEHHGGKTPDGYTLKRQGADSTAAGDAPSCPVIDPDRRPWVDRAKELALGGLGMPSVTRELNREGYRTKTGGLFSVARVQATLTNPFYAGFVMWHRGLPDEEIRKGKHEAIILPDDFTRIQELTSARNVNNPNTRRSAPRGRRTLRFVLGRCLAVCDRCGEGMYSFTRPYTLKDGTQPRYYVCRNVHNGAIRNGLAICDQPMIDAARIDAAILAHLDRLFIDFEAWLESLTDAANGHRAAVEAQRDAAIADVTKLGALEDKLRQRYLDAISSGTNERAAEDALNHVLADRDAAAERVRSLQETLAAVPAEPPTDAMLDVYNSLAQAIRAGDRSDNLADLNERLRAVFSEFRLDTVNEDVAGVLPVLREDAIARHWASGATPAMLDNDGAIPTDALPACVPAVVWVTPQDGTEPVVPVGEAKEMQRSAQLRYHLRSAGTTCQGANSLLQRAIASW